MLHLSTYSTGYLHSQAYPQHLRSGQLFIAALVCSNLNAKRKGGDDKGQQQRQMNTKYKSICKTQVDERLPMKDSQREREREEGNGEGQRGNNLFDEF